MPIDSNPPIASAIAGLRSVSSLDARQLQKSAGQRPAGSTSATAGSVVVSSDARDPGPVPVDVERVSQVRKAIESGTYPLVPARVADAMIAAGMLLRSPK